MLFNAVQSLKEYSPINMAEDEILTFSNDVHPLNKLFSIDIREEESEIVFKDVQLLNEHLPILSNLLGNMTFSKDLQL